MKIIDILKKKRTVSFEFFPPKKEEGESVLFETIEKLKGYDPDFVSVTYGAGGGTRDKTIEWTRSTHIDYGLEAMMHLTCIAATRESIAGIVRQIREIDIENVLALRGDIPLDVPPELCSKVFRNASDLIPYLKEQADLCIGVACYPEGHLETRDIDKEIEHLKLKESLGADFAITQLFFTNDYFYRFMERVRAAGIKMPVIAGIMPITNIKQVMRFTQMCGVEVPKHIIERMENAEEKDMFEIGVDYAAKQSSDLWEQGVEGLHFYTLNRSGATEEVLGRVF
ncbi:methylenetetrahydrofolate reductase [NAD(P)H] [Limisalsivibrio acetivorans]|uniref:methylenetetrahydrofolate reductase [NAD(P)H] n=1 Tax=Limisalsivibrio acetivorans TaxID=1304888 RepID=UPI0003B740CB|nr:methylenetetrahydrofolate reductase [NAD(P)H] [Limisalsivibrio acetivorans]